MTGVVLLAYVAVLVVLASLRSVPVASPIVQRLRAFFPSWRFFDDIGDTPQLWLRVDTGDGLGPWQLCLRHPKRSVRRVLWNPEGNLRLAQDSLLMHLLTDIDEQPTQLADNVSYQLTTQLVAFVVAHHAQAQTIVRYQFKLTSVAAGADPTAGQDILVSPVIAR